jgi:hypothetical protein
MKIFECDHCYHALFFENNRCEKCGHLTGYSAENRDLLTFDPTKLIMESDKDGQLYRYCANREFDVCNWLIPFESGAKYCKACELNRIIPNLSDHQNFQKWRQLEVAKHRLIYQLDRLNLSYVSKFKNAVEGLCFDFLSRSPSHNRMTGHSSGVITILLEEADSVHLEKMKSELLEPYRTLIGHFRHEVGHYFWDLLIAKDSEILAEFRAIFGDERVDYNQALLKYYQSKYQTDWKGKFISQYASSHPWEDWAETWANYLHIMAMAETSFSFGLAVNPSLNERSLEGKIDFDPYLTPDFNLIFKAWLPISFAINSLNRSMGIPDAYPFVVNSAVIKKMKFIHRLFFGMR